MRILQIAEKQSGPAQQGGWQEMARKRYQKGSIRKRGKLNPVWELQYWDICLNPDGSIGRKRVSIILGSVADINRKEAKKLSEEILRPLNSGKRTPYSDILFRDFIEKYFIPNVFPILKQSTQNRYRLTLNKHLLPAFGNFRLSDIRNLDLQQFILHKLQKGLGWECGNHFRNLMSKIFKTAKKWNFFSGDNPAFGVELPPKKAVREKRVLSLDQGNRLLRVLEEPTRTLVHVGLRTGMRVGEILGLRWEDVDWKERQLHVTQAVYRGQIGTPKTKSSKRTLPLSEELLEALASHRKGFQPKDGCNLVFQTSKGTPFSDTNLLHRELKPAGKKIGAPWLSWHTLRRTLCTQFQEAGGSLIDAQKQLGHSRASTTLDIYTLPNSANQRKTIEKL